MRTTATYMTNTSQSTADIVAIITWLRRGACGGFTVEQRDAGFTAAANALEAYALETLEQSATIEELEGRAGMDAAALRCYAAREKALLALCDAAEINRVFGNESVALIPAREIRAILESKP